MKRFGLAVVIAGFAAMVAGPAMAQTGNGGPSGPHYNLNVIGVPKNKTADMTGNNGHRIFVPLYGNTKILLCESGSNAADKNNDLDCSDVPSDGFKVLDANGTDGPAAFALPNPDQNNDGITSYSVFARALGKPDGQAFITTCATDETGELECSSETLHLKSTNGPSKFQNASKELLYIYGDFDEDGTLDRAPLFDDRLEDYHWDYTNEGLKLAQLRFYQCSTIVPGADDPTGDVEDLNCFN